MTLSQSFNFSVSSCMKWELIISVSYHHYKVQMKQNKCKSFEKYLTNIGCWYCYTLQCFEQGQTEGVHYFCLVVTVCNCILMLVLAWWLPPAPNILRAPWELGLSLFWSPLSSWSLAHAWHWMGTQTFKKELKKEYKKTGRDDNGEQKERTRGRKGFLERKTVQDKCYSLNCSLMLFFLRELKTELMKITAITIA